MRTLIYGGSASGKSTFAEALAVKYPAPRYYVAAMQPYGEEGAARILRHRKMREGKGFETVERYTDIGGLVLPKRGTVLLECMCNLTANEMFNPDGAHEKTFDHVRRGIDSLAARCSELIVVTNDVSSEQVDLYDESTRDYLITLGKLNAALAQDLDCVIEIVCGIPLYIKGELHGIF